MYGVDDELTSPPLVGSVVITGDQQSLSPMSSTSHCAADMNLQTNNTCLENEIERRIKIERDDKPPRERDIIVYLERRPAKYRSHLWELVHFVDYEESRANIHDVYKKQIDAANGNEERLKKNIGKGLYKLISAEHYVICKVCVGDPKIPFDECVISCKSTEQLVSQNITQHFTNKVRKKKCPDKYTQSRILIELVDHYHESRCTG